jgi:hypothetical protein
MADFRREVVKKLTSLSKADEVDIYASLTRNMTTAQAKDLNRLLQTIGEPLRKEKKASKFKHVVSRKERLSALIGKINSSLGEYDSNDNIQQWNVDVSTSMEFNPLDEKQLVDYHNRLMDSYNSLNNIKLIIHYERGRFYSFIRNKLHGEWLTFCKDVLKVCRQTANCHIDFFNVIATYPRLVICKIPFESIMSYKKELLDIFNRKDNDLAERLKMPLKEVNIHTAVEIPQFVGKNDDICLEYEGDMAAGWEIENEIRSVREMDDQTYLPFEDAHDLMNEDGDNISIHSDSTAY